MPGAIILSQNSINPATSSIRPDLSVPMVAVVLSSNIYLDSQYTAPQATHIVF